MEKKPTSHIIKGLIIAVIMIILDQAGAIPSLKTAKWYIFAPSIVLVTASIINVIHYCSQMNGKVKFGDAFAFGFKTAAIVALIMVLYTFIYLRYIHPELKQLAYEDALAEIMRQGNTLLEDAKKRAREYADSAFIPGRISMTLISTLVVSALGSAMGAAVAKRNQ